MKSLFALIIALLSTYASALEYNGFKIDADQFDAGLQSLEKGASSAESVQSYYWQTSATTCQAATICPNGRQIWCRTYGFNYSNVPSHMTNSCRWMVLPGRAVRCQGYTLNHDYYGRAFWSYVDIPVSCF